MSKLVLVRHGKTQYNLDHRFCGLTDAPLADEGVKNAEKLASKLEGFHFDYAYSSTLRRAYETGKIILERLGQVDLAIIQDARLNERDYGLLTGKSHQEVECFFGTEQVERWRRSWDLRPPEGESLADVSDRVIPYFKDEIFPKLVESDVNILLSAHGNSLRALIAYLDQLSFDQIGKLEIVYEMPYIYEFDRVGMHRIIDQIPRQFEKISP